MIHIRIQFILSPTRLSMQISLYPIMIIYLHWYRPFVYMLFKKAFKVEDLMTHVDERCRLRV